MNLPDEKPIDWTKAANRLVEYWLTNPEGGYAEIEYKPTIWQRIKDIPYLIAYWVTKPIAWLIHEVWSGVENAWLNVWEE